MVNFYIYYNMYTHTHTYIHIYIYIYKIAVNSKRYTGIDWYPKYIVPLAKSVQPSVRYWLPCYQGRRLGGSRGGSCAPWPPKKKILYSTILSLFHRFICLFKQNNVCRSHSKTKFLFFLLHVLNFLSCYNFFFPRGAFVTQLFPLN